MEDIFTQDIKDLIKLATTDFHKFYKETEKQNKSSGNYSKAASSGNYSKAASSGYCSTAASSGYCSKAASSGKNSGCSALGYRAAVKGDLGNLIMCSEYANEGVPIGGKADIVDGKNIKADCWYIVESGEWVEVDLSDGIFSRVISTKGNVKKCRRDNDKIIYVITVDGVSAHGNTIKQARDDLAFKQMSKDVDQFKGMPLKTKKTTEEWALVYRAITGACQYGTQDFISKNSTKKEYTLKEILSVTRGSYGHERFKEAVSK